VTYGENFPFYTMIKPDQNEIILPDPEYGDIPLVWPALPSPSAHEDHLAKRFSRGKLRYDLIPPEALEALATICSDGAISHGEDNWLKGMPHRTTYASLMRHVQSWWAGVDIDPTSNRSHSWHIFWNAMVMVVMEARLKAGDERFNQAEIDNRPYKALMKGLG
jgi:hypothetical protein